jgi:hypothetical protein
MINRRFFLFLLATFFLLSIFLPSITSFVINWWWFQEIGFSQLFLTKLNLQFTTGIAVFLFAGIFLFGNFILATSAKNPWFVTMPPALIGQALSLTDRFVKKAGTLGIFSIAILLGFAMSFYWTILAQFLSAESFNSSDPIFNKDISFYVFSLPFYSIALGLLKTLTVISLIGCGVIYILRGNINITEILPKIKSFKIQKTTDPKARLHIGFLLALFLFITAAGTYLSQYSLLTDQNGVVSGASFTDITFMIPLLNISVFVYLLAALMALFYGLSGRLKPLFGSIFISIFVSITMVIVPSIFQKLIVAPNELAKETPFIKHNIKATRAAYGLNNIEKKTIPADKPLTATDIEANNPTIKNVRLWDRQPLLSTFSQIQEIRTYYEFASVDNDRYTINGETRQIMLSPRELATASLPNRNWINEHLTFTHGYGIAAGPVNQVTPEGLPVLFVKDLPPKSEIKELEVKQPEIYFGELVNDYVLVKTKSKEFDYPKGEENVYSTYKGNGGVEINSPLKKLLFALHFSSLKMLLSDDIDSKSRIIYNRDIKERVAKIAPFLTLDHDPYLVVADGKLYWIFDGYTMTDRYPYSQKISFNDHPINYIRNSVKVVVDAYNGSVTFYQTDVNDPIIKTYAKIFPNTFKPLSDMPKNLLSHIRYPEDIFTAQTEIYSTYHMDDPQIFYNKEDQWEVPMIAQEGEQQTTSEVPLMTPRHMIMKLPGVEKEEFILMLPFTPRAKDNLSAWMVARNDGEKYGKLAVYSFPKDKLIFGPKQIIGRINQDPQVSQQISLWDQRGSQVIQGPLLVIPIEQSLVYIRPLYLKAETGKIPELKRVIVAYENKIAMEETLEKGLAKIFGTETDQAGADKPTAEAAPSTDEEQEVTLQQAQDTYERAVNAQRNGDWKTYGEQINLLGEILKKLNQ